MKTVLVTGGLGFIGIHTVFVLIKRDYKVVIIDSLFNSNQGAFKNLKNLLENEKIEYKKKLNFIEGDIRDLELLKKIFNDANYANNNIDAVIHFAGLKSVEESCNFPHEYWDVNVSGTIGLLKIMKENNCRKIVFSSSATIYSKDVKSPINEGATISPVNPYGQTKATVECFLKDLSKSDSSWSVFCLRYFNPIGAHSSGLIGENPTNNANNLFPHICKVASGEKRKLFIFGDDWQTEDGTGIRDYVHVMDIAEAHEISLSQLFDDKSGFIALNLGTGKGTSVLELIKIFEKVNNLKISFKITERRKGDIACCYADNKFAKNFLNWTPSRSIEDMCRDSWSSYSNRLKNI